jgi:hypothetical protein
LAAQFLQPLLSQRSGYSLRRCSDYNRTFFEMQIYIALKLDWACQPYSGRYNHTPTSSVYTGLNWLSKCLISGKIIKTLQVSLLRSWIIYPYIIPSNRKN